MVCQTLNCRTTKGGLADRETTASEFRHRTYDPALGRWLQRDPSPTPYVDGMNMYTSFAANPLTNVDSLGMKRTFTVGQEFAASAEIFDGDTSCGKVEVKGKVLEKGVEIAFSWVEAPGIPKGKGEFLRGGVGWIQHVQTQLDDYTDPSVYRYDNAAEAYLPQFLRKEGAKSDPNAHPQPTKRPAELKPDQQWKQNPWYGGAGNITEPVLTRINQAKQRSQAPEPADVKCLNEFITKPQPQTQIIDKVYPLEWQYMYFYTQLVSVETGEVLYNYSWTVEQKAGKMSLVEGLSWVRGVVQAK